MILYNRKVTRRLQSTVLLLITMFNGQKLHWVVVHGQFKGLDLNTHFWNEYLQQCADCSPCKFLYSCIIQVEFGDCLGNWSDVHEVIQSYTPPYQISIWVSSIYTINIHLFSSNLQHTRSQHHQQCCVSYSKCAPGEQVAYIKKKKKKSPPLPQNKKLNSLQ